jgi:hypothetical protein
MKSISYPVQPNSLTHPIHTRRIQLAYPTIMLHSTAQRVVLGMGSSILAGFGTAWAGWAEKLGVLGGAIGPGLELETAIGTGMLISVAGVWWMVGKWERAKKKWWRDWDRVGQGLERDLKASYMYLIHLICHIHSRCLGDSSSRGPRAGCIGSNINERGLEPHRRYATGRD